MDAFKKPETLIIAVLAIVLIGYIAYDYRKHNAQSEKVKQIEEHLSVTVRAVDTIAQQMGRINPMAQELIKLKERQEELEELEEKCEELTETLEDMLAILKDNGITVDLDFPVFGEKKKKKSKKSKKGKKDKRSKRDKDVKKKGKKSKKEQSSDSESSSDDDKTKAIARISRIHDKKKNGN